MTVHDAPGPGKALPDVTVVVPFHDVVEFLPEMLESLELQDAFDRCQVVLVDDGSSDGSADVATSFARRHANVEVLTQANAGPGPARNAGMSRATGTHLMFVDSDDLLPAGAISHLIGLMGPGVDLAVGAMETFPAQTSWPWTSALDDGHRVLRSLGEAPELVHGAGPCNKLFRRDFVTMHALRFADKGHFEDVQFVVAALAHSSGTALTDRLVYRYRKRWGGGSIMDAVFTRVGNFEDHLAAVEYLADLTSQVSPPVARALQTFMVRSMQGFLLRAPDALAGEALDCFMARAHSVFRDVPAEVVRGATLDLRHRLPFLAVLSEHPPSVAEVRAAARRLVSHDGALSVDLAVDPGYRELLVLGPVRAFLESVEVDARRRRLVLEGRWTARGIDLSEVPEIPLHVRLKGSGVTVEATPVHRPELAAANPAHRYAGFRAVVPLDRLRSGTLQPRMVLETPTGQASTSMRPSLGYLRSARVLRLGSRRLVPRTDPDDRCTLDVGGGPATRGRRWRWALVRDDLAQWLQARPMGGLRVLRLVTSPAFRSRDVWLIGERGDTAQDNGAALFRHIRDTRPRQHAYYVTDVPRHPALSGLGHVVRRGSLRHVALTLHARLLVGAYDIDAYLLPPRWDHGEYLRHLAWRVGSRRAFLQHGVIYNDVSRALHRSSTGLSLFVTSAAREAQEIRERLGYTSQVVLTGLPRLDQLAPCPAAAPRRVLFMPTWRTTLVSPSYATTRRVGRPFEGSDYQRFLSDLLTSPRLHRVLEEHDLVLEFYPHYEIADVVAGLAPDHPRIEVATADRTVRDALAESSLFVTDWSSVFFDAAAIGLPVVTAPFDEEAFRATQYAKGYFDLVLDGFGPAVRRPEEVVAAIEIYARRGFRREPRYDDRVASFFGVLDRGNSARVLQALDRVAAR